VHSALTPPANCVSLLIIILETNIWILTMCETHRKADCGWPILYPVLETLIIGCLGARYITDAEWVGQRFSGLNTRDGEN